MGDWKKILFAAQRRYGVKPYQEDRLNYRQLRGHQISRLSIERPRIKVLQLIAQGIIESSVQVTILK